MSNTLKQKFTFVKIILYPTFFWVLSQCVILPQGSGSPLCWRGSYSQIRKKEGRKKLFMVGKRELWLWSKLCQSSWKLGQNSESRRFFIMYQVICWITDKHGAWGEKTAGRCALCRHPWSMYLISRYAREPPLVCRKTNEEKHKVAKSYLQGNTKKKMYLQEKLLKNNTFGLWWS